MYDPPLAGSWWEDNHCNAYVFCFNWGNEEIPLAQVGDVTQWYSL